MDESEITIKQVIEKIARDQLSEYSNRTVPPDVTQGTQPGKTVTIPLNEYRELMKKASLYDMQRESSIKKERLKSNKSDTLQRFLDTRCIKTHSGGVSVTALLDAYNQFAGKYSAALSRADFVELMERHGYVKQRLGYGPFQNKIGYIHLGILAD